MDRTHYIADAKKSAGSRVRIAGWVHDFRDLGKLKFALVRDRTGILQVTMKKGVVKDELLAAVALNKEDVVSFGGTLKENRIAPDGVELVPDEFVLLNKVERKLPVDPTGVVPSELDTRIDFRYLDLRKKDTSAIFRIKSVAATAFREKLLELGFIEIHPSAITGAATEGGADVFPIQYFENRAYLVQSPQLYKQLAVIGGFDRVFMTVPVFRAEKHNTTTHLNEIVQMDIEMGFADHLDAMDVLEKVTLHILRRVKEGIGPEIAALSPDFDVPEKVPRYSYTELVERLDKETNIKMKWGEDFTKEAEKKLYELLDDELYFIYDWPTAIRAFYSMPDQKDKRICHAFDLVYRGLDPHGFEFYLNAFRMGAPPHAGWSIGLERLTMKMCNLENIREATLFPRDRTRLHP